MIEESYVAQRNWCIEADNLSKSFGSQHALRKINLKIRQGELVALFGPNGAGKTTFLKILATLIKPSSGRLKIADLDLKDDSVDIRRRIGIVSHETLLYNDLTPYENLKFYGRMYGVPDLEERIQTVVRQVGMESRLHQRVGTFSHGMQKRIAIARAILHNPSIMLLDEPESGLDQYAASMLEQVLNDLCARDRTVIMTTHNMERGLKMSNHVVIMAQGRIVHEEQGHRLDVADFSNIYLKCTGARR